MSTMKNALNSAPARPDPALTALIADASQITRRVMAATIGTILPRAKILEAASGPEAFAALKTGSVEIAFVDMDLPDLNGTEAVARARREGARPFVILMAQDIKPGWESCSREIEAYEFLEKPLEVDEIRQIVANYLRIKEPCRVLVADDSKTFRHLIKKVLAASRFDIAVDVVDNGETAVGLLRQQAYDVIFLDYDMPSLDGLEIACLIHEVCPAARVVMVSAHHTDSIEKAARYFGVVEFLKKPFSPAAVDRALHLAFDLPVPSLLESLGMPQAMDDARLAAAAG
jgi:CheY-like chemotaxis protein